MEIIEKLLRLWRGPVEEPAGRKRRSVKPSEITYGIDDKPPAYVVWVAAIQHVLLASVTTIFPLLVLEAAHASHQTVLEVMSGSLLALGFGTILLCLKSQDLGSSSLMPAAFSGVYFTVTVVAAKQGGLPLVAGMTIFAGLVQLLIGTAFSVCGPFYRPKSPASPC